MMEKFVAGFIRSGLVWLGVGVTIGVWMAFRPEDAYLYRPAHMHANLLGFVSMMIFGVAYHVIPRFAGVPLHGRRIAYTHFIVANAGLGLMVGSWLARGAFPLAAGYTLRLGAALSALGAGLFIYNLWRTLNAGESLVAERRAAHRPPMRNPAAPVEISTRS